MLVVISLASLAPFYFVGLGYLIGPSGREVTNRLKAVANCLLAGLTSFLHACVSVWRPLVLGLVPIVVWWILKKRLPISFFPAALTGLIYFLALALVYLLTPFDLKWHLDTSVVRTLFSVRACLLVATYFLLEQFENDQEGGLIV